ncbi:hypothetical protein PVK06_007952 [Gossypium arboreum]|uniref:Uncharacterized protein n=1 Tax=Gossypium arboreum TaxID=29729 RepID=A0ABR0QJX9_GOSAR|nr:hypothetical protein PVK06_007952 [Gossypium arboreum]
MWDVEKIASSFDPDVANRIQGIPLALNPQSDMVVWQVDPSSEYTVQSGYRLLQGNKDLNENTVECYNLFYKKLWKLEFSEKVHDRVFSLSQHIVSMISSYVAELNEIMKKLAIVKGGLERWRPPDEPFVKVNFEAAFHILSSNSCSRIIIRDGRSKTIAEKVTVNGNIVLVFTTKALHDFKRLA